jgi:hypothetical protein
MRNFIDIVNETVMSDSDTYYYVVGKVRDLYTMRATIDGYCEDGVIYLDLISVDDAGNGVGTEMMKEICFNADDHHIAIELEAGSHGRGNISQRKLEDWYGRFGFKKTGAVSSEDHPYMRREPSAT